MMGGNSEALAMPKLKGSASKKTKGRKCRPEELLDKIPY